jgi:hypothetical protein
MKITKQNPEYYKKPSTKRVECAMLLEKILFNLIEQEKFCLDNNEKFELRKKTDVAQFNYEKYCA